MGVDSEEFLLFSRNEPLHLLLDVLAENDEEDELLSSKLRTQRESVSLVQYQSNSFGLLEWFQMKSQLIPFFVLFAFSFDRHAKSFASSCDACSSS